MSTVTRFAPSPTGRLHIGHAYSALFAYGRAAKPGGRFILRIEDIDAGRCRPEFEDGIYEDLSWLGVAWEEPVRRQSEHMDDYRAALDKLEDGGLLYPCFCTRKEIQAEITRSPSAPHGPEGYLYPGTCRDLGKSERADKIASGVPYALRLDIAKACAETGPLTWLDHAKGLQTAAPETLGDIVLARKDTPAGYHLCVTLDDHLQGVTLVTRGEDLFHATHMHRLLQELLGLNVPEWCHHKMLLDEEGRRFAKRNNAITLQYLRESGKTPADITAMTGFS
ncbi:MAG: tRNA glutamyl-Q(34) synthetase GluQRS [Proteobacteria bacterium]|nr:tRNA glutamyl-Q(34) synthetase GluQRS [Pseudomonadota bacterium]